MQNMDWRTRSWQVYCLSSEDELWLQDYKLEYTSVIRVSSYGSSSGYYTLSFPESKNAIRFYVPHEYSKDFSDLPDLEKIEYLESNGNWIDVSQDEDFTGILWPFITDKMIRI